MYIFPEDVLPAIAAGVLDRDLFNVTYLAEHGYADADAGHLPVIVTYPAPAGRPGGSAPLAAKLLTERVEQLPATPGKAVALPSINGAGVAVEKKTAAQFWHRLRGAEAAPTAPKSAPRSGAGSGSFTVASRPAGPSVLAAGVGKVWLDRELELSLAESVPLIGAPAAWSAGYDGSGVNVAVLDSGVDATHPDLAGKVATAVSFIPGSDAGDRHGHGTHVASTIAGSGAASGGRYKGVAPGARLLSAKVCFDTNGCPTSSILQGMEWAATEQDADIVSISLGGCCTDGTDPLSQAVNSLTARTGTLFVIAAGNDGPNAQTVGSPGTAEAALTVAATDKRDQMARFSSRGPRLDGALKPDIAAPGVDIVAARAAGTTLGTPVDARYTSANGTSMATPHVSGAAALLAQRYPDLTGPELKAALMSSAHDAGHSVYEQGAGRVNAARAVDQEVFATTPNVDFGRITGDTGSDPVSKRITYRNLTDQPVELTLTPSLRSMAGEPAPNGALTVDGTLTVPAGGAATATVILNVGRLGLETYSGTVVAADEASGVRLSTPVGLDRRVALTVQVLGPDGQPAVPSIRPRVQAVDVPGEQITDVTSVGVGRYQALVRPGTYSVMAGLTGHDGTAGRKVSAYLIDPQITVTGGTEVILDGRQARPMSIATPRPAAPYALSVNYERSHADGSITTISTTGSITWAQTKLWVTPTERVTVGEFQFSSQWTLANPPASMRVRGANDLALQPMLRAHADRGLTFDPGAFDWAGGWLPFTRNGTFELVDAGFGDPEDIAGHDLRGKLALLQWGDDRWGAGNTPPDGTPDLALWVDRLNNLHRAGAIGVIAFSNPPPGYEHHRLGMAPTTPANSTVIPDEQKLLLPEVQIQRDEGKRLLDLVRKGTVTIGLTSDPNIRYSYQLSLYHDQQVSTSLDHRFGERDLARVESTFHATQPGPAFSRDEASKPGAQPGASSDFEFAVPQTRTQYFGPVDPRMVRRSEVFYRDASGTKVRLEAAARVFGRPGQTTERWGTAPVAPGAAPSLPPDLLVHPAHKTGARDCIGCREGDLIYPKTVGITGSLHAAEDVWNSAVRLHREGGQEIPLSMEGFLPVFRLPQEPGTYRLTESKRDLNNTTTTWTFKSEHPERATAKPGTLCWLSRGYGHNPCHPEPFVFLRYDLGKDLQLNNTVKAPGLHTFTVTAYNGQSIEAMPRIDGMKVWTSLDDGQTWQRAVVLPKGRGDGDGRSFQVLTGYPAVNRTSGAVSLKVEAWDVDGNRVEQRVDRAFALSANRYQPSK
ncbi:S8 family serine peptidase [Plantactinospora sp. ZYX-F-223]|uniref:S8 family peptidase n=1 Tax=Plantactinospora sp. ZYX-F-223 TaxID=3144103 RepID=UPI0031FC333A